VETGTSETFKSIESDCGTLWSWLCPDFTNMTNEKQEYKFYKFHWWLMVGYVAATAAFWASLAKVESLGIHRTIPISISVVSPPVNATSDPFNDAFQIESRNVSVFPPTVFLAVAATIHMIYHAIYGVIRRAWIKEYLKQRTNPTRWIFTACAKSLELTVLFVFNGEREVTSIIFLSLTIAGACFLAHALDESVKTTCNEKGKKSQTSVSSLLGSYSEVVNYGRAITILTAGIAAVFATRLGYNGTSTPPFVYGLSIAFIIVEFLRVAIYIYTTYQLQCNKGIQRVTFATGDWVTSLGDFVTFCFLGAFVLGYMSVM
jgi:hypothetical protein